MSIQNDIDAAPPGGTVNIIPGIYNEQLVIDKPLTLSGPDPGTGVAARCRRQHGENRQFISLPVM